MDKKCGVERYVKTIRAIRIQRAGVEKKVITSANYSDFFSVVSPLVVVVIVSHFLVETHLSPLI